MTDTYLMIAVASIVPAFSFVGLIWFIARRKLRAHDRQLQGMDARIHAHRELVCSSNDLFVGTERVLDRDDDHAAEVIERIAELPPSVRQ